MPLDDELVMGYISCIDTRISMNTSQVKSNLAKLLATENLTVEHNNVSTASFDVEKRVLVLPVWENISNDVYTLLVGHEVGHALFTPATDVFDVPRSFLNVVEDARVEKMIKLKYPGLSKSFCRGYSELSQKDFFELEGEKVSEMKLIDRINLHFKLGLHTISTIIPFNKEEEVYVEMVDNCETFDDVIETCKTIYSYINENSKKEDNNQVTVINSENGQVPDDLDIVSKEQDDMTHEEMLEEAEKRESENEEETKDTDEWEDGDNSVDSSYDSEDELEADTDKVWTRNTQKLVSEFTKEHLYLNVPTDIDWDQHVEPYSVFSENMDNNFKVFKAYEYVDRLFETWETQYREFMQESSKSVSYLVKEFEMKKSAEEYSRSSVSKTGVLDCNKIHSYKWCDDIFKRNMIIPEGKNHGLIMYIDWSGSMYDNLEGTIKQLINLICFCRKVNIPYQVFAFTDAGRYDHRKNIVNSESDHEISITSRFRLVEISTSKIKKIDFDAHLLKLWNLTKLIISRQTSFVYGNYDLNGTPLNEAILAAPYVFKKFLKENKVSNVNTVFLTDGESNNIAYSEEQEPNDDGEIWYRRRVIHQYMDQYCVCLKDVKTGYVETAITKDSDYTTTGYKVTAALLRYYKWMTNSNVVGFRISSPSDLKYIVNGSTSDGEQKNHYRKQWKQNKSFVISNIGYDELYVLSNSVDFQGKKAEIKADHSNTKSKIRNEFRKYVKTKSFNKIILSKFVGQIA